MTFLSVVETFGAVVVALGGLETFKWIKRTWFPNKNEKCQDKAEADKAVVEVQQSVQNLETSFHDMWKENMKSMNDIDNERIESLRSSINTVNKTNAELISQLTESQKENARLNEVISDKVAKIRELEESRINITKEYEEKITALTRQLGNQEKLTMFYRTWHCEREYGRGKEMCLRRKPAQEPPLKYCPPELVITQVTEIAECEECKPLPQKSKAKAKAKSKS